MIILLVENEPLIAIVLEEGLRDAVHTVRGPAPTVEGALEMAQHEPPELALVNINLRGGGSGIDLAREMLDRWGVPSLFVSGQRIEAYANRTRRWATSRSLTVRKPSWPASKSPGISLRATRRLQSRSG